MKCAGEDCPGGQEPRNPDGTAARFVQLRVEGGGAEQSVGEGVAPLGEVEVGGDDGGAAFVALGDEVMEVLVLRCSQGFQTEVIDDEQRHAGEGLEAPLVRIDGARGMEARQQLALGGEQHVVVGANGGMAEGLCDVGLSGAARPGAEDDGVGRSPPCCRASPWLPSWCRLLRADEGKRRPDALPRTLRSPPRSRPGSLSRWGGAQIWRPARSVTVTTTGRWRPRRVAA